MNSELSTKAEGAVISIEIADIYVTNDQTSVYWPVLFDTYMPITHLNLPLTNWRISCQQYCSNHSNSNDVTIEMCVSLTMCTQANCCHGTAHTSTSNACCVHNSIMQTVYQCHDVIGFISYILRVPSLLALQVSSLLCRQFMVAI